VPSKTEVELTASITENAVSLAPTTTARLGPPP
jgi:hypothetical protein